MLTKAWTASTTDILSICDENLPLTLQGNQSHNIVWKNTAKKGSIINIY